MFHSIRWRLITSYVLLTIITVSSSGFIAQWAVKTYAQQQAINSLNANAESIARQALPLIETQVPQLELSQLARAASQFGNVQVRLLDRNRLPIVDSGLPDGTNAYMWFMLPRRVTGLIPDQHLEGWIIGMPLLRQPFSEEDWLPFFDQLTPNASLTIVRRVEEPWGHRLSFVTTTGQGLVPTHERIAVSEPANRSPHIITVPIGNPKSPVGYVELSNGTNFGAEALATTRRALLISGAVAVLLAAILGLVMGKRLTTPVTDLTEATRQMSAGDLSVRASVSSKDEIGELATQFNQMAGQLQTSFDQLATERDTLRRFIADAAHELRTPITALQNFNELLQGTAADDADARVEFLNESHVQLNRLTWITQNLLDLSRLDTGLADLEFGTHEVKSLYETAIAPYRASAEEKGINLTINLPEMPIKLRCDRAWVEIALSNLLDNAVKFTSSGGSIEIGAQHMETIIHLWVKDTGPGIQPDELPHIFDRFYRGKGAQSKGSGLGLSIVHSVVLAHEGQVSVKSRVDEGTIITLEFPSV